MPILFTIFLCVALAYLFGEIAKLIKLPRVIGQIFAGVMLTHPFLKTILFDTSSSSTLASLANIGFVLLLFFAGLEINFSRKYNIERSVLISFFNTLVPLAAGFLAGKWFGLDTIPALITGITLAVGAVAVSIDVLEELKILKSAFASLLISIGAADDILELLLIAIILAVVKVSLFSTGFSYFLAGAVLFIISVVILKSVIIPFILSAVERERSATSLLTGSLIVALLMAALSEVLGLGSLIGALFAGIIVRYILLSGKDRRPWEEHQIAKTMHTLTFGFFAPLFFVFIGLQTNFYEHFDLFFGILLVFIALAGCFVGVTIGNMLAFRPHHDKKIYATENALLGFGLAAKGDTDLIIASIALQNQLISQSLFSSLVFMSIVTTILSIILFRRLLKNKCSVLRLCKPMHSISAG